MFLGKAATSPGGSRRTSPSRRSYCGSVIPPPWSVDELEACFVVVDSVRQKLGYVYYEEEPGRRSAAKLLIKDEARWVAVNISPGLPELVRKLQ